MDNITHGILIDPYIKSLDVIQINDEHKVVDLLGLDMTFDCPMTWDTQGDLVYFAKVENALPGTLSFRIDGVFQPIFGKGLILGHSGTGRICGPRVPYTTWIRHVHFTFQFRLSDTRRLSADGWPATI